MSPPISTPELYPGYRSLSAPKATWTLSEFACGLARSPRKNPRRPCEVLGSSRRTPVRDRPINMSPKRWFVKTVNTIYCASVLGQSQDVDICAWLCKSGRWTEKIAERFRDRKSGVKVEPLSVRRAGRQVPALCPPDFSQRPGFWCEAPKLLPPVE